MGSGLLAVRSGFILFIKNYQFPLQINTLERERARNIGGSRTLVSNWWLVKSIFGPKKLVGPEK
jgi:hypothetical protein